MPNNDTRKQTFLANVKHRLGNIRQQLTVWQALAAELEEWDGRKPNKRIETKLLERLGEDKFYIGYTPDKQCRWIILSIYSRTRRETHDGTGRLGWQVYIHCDIANGATFDFRKWYEGNTFDSFYESIANHENMLTHPELAEVFFSQLDWFAKEVMDFKERIAPFDKFSHLVDKRTEKTLQDINTLSYNFR